MTTSHDTGAWQQEGLCSKVDADVLFSNDSADIAAAKAMCGQCPVARKCLDFAMSVETAADTTHGIYGGLTPDERIELRRHQMACARCATTFQRVAKHQRYCSPDCANAARREAKAASGRLRRAEKRAMLREAS